MNPVFADTSFYIALLHPRDSLHTRAIAVIQRLARRIVTTEIVLLEVANYFRKASVRGSFVQLISEIQSDPETDVIPCSSDLFMRGVRLFANRLDKDWSLTDCVSFIVMTDRKLTEALTADRHFEQAGFLALLS